jgi:hypothetical protein
MVIRKAGNSTLDYIGGNFKRTSLTSLGHSTAKEEMLNRAFLSLCMLKTLDVDRWINSKLSLFCGRNYGTFIPKRFAPIHCQDLGFQLIQAVVNGRRTSLQYERSIKAFLDLSFRHAKGPETAVNVD